MGWSGGRGAVGVRPLLVACAAFLAGAFFGVSLAWWAALAALPLAIWRPARAAAAGLALGLLREGAQEQVAPFTLGEEFEGVVISPDVVRVPQGLAAIRLRGIAVHRGDRARFFGQVHVPPGRLNPGGRDRRAQLAARGIAVEGSAEVIEVLGRGPRIWRWFDELRGRFAERARAVCSSPEHAALVTALAVGDRSGLSRETEDELAASGLVHLLASSGLHLAVVALVVRDLARRAWLRTHWAARVRAGVFAAAVALPFAAFEGLLLGAPWPAGRAGAGGGIGLLGSAPLLAGAFHRISLVSVVANALGLLPGLAAIPLATLLVPFDLLPLWWVTDLLARATLAASHFFAWLPYATVVVAAPGLIAWALWYGGVGLCI